MDTLLKFPSYAKAFIVLIGLYVLIATLSIMQEILVPLIFSVMIAVLLHPVVNILVRIRINRVIAIIVTLVLTFIITAALAVLIFRQLAQFTESWPILVDKFELMLNQTSKWISQYFDLSRWKVNRWTTNAKTEMLSMSNAQVGQTLYALGGWVVTLLLIPVYVFLFLFYNKLLIEFIHRVFGNSDQDRISKIILEIKSVIQSYLAGLLIEAVIVAILNITALLVLGIEYAILLGILGALLNVIPYIGGLVAVALPMAVALATKSTPMFAFYVLALYYLIQLIDNNIIVPLIVSSKVKINALFAILVVFAGNALWGVSGMFLSIPLLAIVKLICDHIESLKPWGFLLGDTMPPILDIEPILKKMKIKIKVKDKK